MSEEQVQQQEEEISYNVVDDASPQDDVNNSAVETEDELDRYTKNVSKRINNLNKRNREAEERALQAERLLAQKAQENEQLRKQTQELTSNVLVAEEQSIQAKEQQADELYKKAVASGDADLMSKADTLKSDLSIQKEKLRIAKNRQQQEPEVTQTTVTPEPQQQKQQQEVQPTKQALEWKDKNSWYGDPSRSEETQYAYFQHFNLVNEGYEADSEEYYNELNNRVYKVYPDLGGSVETAEKTDAKPTVQRVASTSVGSRQKTQAKKGGVTFSKSEMQRLKTLKPHNMSEDDWLKRVAKEKQKISQREVS